ncbi:UDP-glucose 4-epimerase [Amphibacillus marinus]|uniref:UDP-glucose 4-epimerase n=1 Tax=Amphibacillus marinus TaxID=872970 RepID=A0A1H8N6F7_9BACI|nr:NAD-dependent epimerase/dehydratase family protein [Amphibacillus marinus]SEO25195.1 UDP-glucose 4-epimerase [Amphibacillus marinus]
MKHILITGKNSYIGNSFTSWLAKYPNDYEVTSIDMRDDKWKQEDFSKYDVVFHVAGIAHVKEKKKNRDLYYKVNRDLAFETAKKAKEDGVKHFIFLSSMSVYGLETGVIDRDTPEEPKSHYGISKLEAEKLIAPLNSDSFKVSILRPPMIYGKGCKGNYPKLAKLAKLSPIFPAVENKRSMLFIDHLSEFTRLLIEQNLKGFFFPQNNEYVNTSRMVKSISQKNHKDIKLTSIFNPIIRVLRFSVVKKIFGDLYYKIEDNHFNYNLYNFEKTVELVED